MIHEDTTHKAIYERCPVYPIGYSDKNRTFHPALIGVLSGEKASNFTSHFKVWKEFHPDMEPDFGMCDSAGAIRKC